MAFNEKRRCYQRRSGAPNAWNRPTSTGTGGSDPRWLCWRGRPARDPPIRLRRIRMESTGTINNFRPEPISNQTSASKVPLMRGPVDGRVADMAVLMPINSGALGTRSHPRIDMRQQRTAAQSAQLSSNASASNATGAVPPVTMAASYMSSLTRSLIGLSPS